MNRVDRIEGLPCGLADGPDAVAVGGPPIRRVFVIGGGARSEAVRRIAPAVPGVPVFVPPPSEYVADCAARQAAWVLAGGSTPPAWPTPGTQVFEADPAPFVWSRYGEVRDLTALRVCGPDLLETDVAVVGHLAPPTGSRCPIPRQ